MRVGQLSRLVVREDGSSGFATLDLQPTHFVQAGVVDRGDGTMPLDAAVKLCRWWNWQAHAKGFPKYIYEPVLRVGG